VHEARSERVAPTRMRPLLFVNWSSVNARFTALMWAVAIVLAIVVLAHVAGGGSASSAAHLHAAAGSAPVPATHSR